jgi:putative ATP-binding cassette transporter
VARPSRPEARRPSVFGRRFARSLWRLLRVYWASPDAARGAALLLGAVALELATVWTNVLISDAHRRIFDALELKEADAFFASVAFFFAVTSVFVLASTYRIFLRQTLEMRWRRVLTAHYIERWIGARAYLQSKLHAGEIDNPDQRIQEDARDFVASALGLSLSLLAAVATLASFGGLLWRESSEWPIRVAGTEFQVPGFMIWVAALYALFSMWITHVVGRRLVPINFDRLRLEADFRYGLVRFRDNAEAVVLSRGESVERSNALARFLQVVRNWWQLIRAQRNLALTTTGLGHANDMVPILAAAPAYFAHLITLGSIAQIRIAYGHVSAALIWFVNAYQEIARWRANIERLAAFAEVMDATERDLATPRIEVATGRAPELRLSDLRLEAPDGTPLVAGASGLIRAGERVAVTGASGSGKTILLRAIAGIWPFGSGRVELPRCDRLLFVTERPYLPLGSLRAAVSFPAPEGTLPDERIRETLRLLGLEHLEGRLDAVESWDQELSDHERQRLAFVRVFLHEPDWLFLDMATSALDEAMERRVYELLAERLPRTTVITAAHRPAVVGYHARRWTIAPHDGGPGRLLAA